MYDTPNHPPTRKGPRNKAAIADATDHTQQAKQTDRPLYFVCGYFLLLSLSVFTNKILLVEAQFMIHWTFHQKR